MYFAYIDESGSPKLKDKDNQFYVLAAVVMQERGLNFLNFECDKTKQELWDVVRTKDDSESYPPKFEIHMDDINGRRRLYKTLKDDEDKWYKVVSKVYNLISKLFVKIMAVIIVKEDFYMQYPNDNLTKWAFELLVERINRYVIKKSSNENGYVKECGLLVMDSIDIEADSKKRKQILEFMERGTGHGWEEYPENIIVSPFIVNSELHNGVQIVDAVVYLLRWYIRKIYKVNPSAFFHQYSEEFLRLIIEKFHEYPNFGSNTIKFFPTNTSVPEHFWDIFKI